MSVDTFLALGDDQKANQFQLVFPNGIPGGGNAQQVCLRMDQSFDPPEQNVNVYELFFRGTKIPKTGMLEETTKEFTFDILIDQQWAVYDALWTWKTLCYDGSNGTALPDATTRTVMVVQALDGQNNVVKSFRFKGVKMKGLKVNTFDNTSGDPLRCAASFIYADMIPE